MIEFPDPDTEAADEARWEVSLADSQDILAKLADKAHEDYLAGRTEEFDPDIEDL